MNCRLQERFYERSAILRAGRQKLLAELSLQSKVPYGVQRVVEGGDDKPVCKYSGNHTRLR